MNDMALRVSEEALLLEEDLQNASRGAVTDNAQLFSEAEARWVSELQAPKPVVATGKKAGTWSEKLGKMRSGYPNAYKPWTDAQDDELKKLHSEGVKTKTLTSVFGRHPGSIRARIKKFTEE